MSSINDDADEFGYDLVMPFLPVQSNGGPHDDAAYVAGYEMGLLDAQLSQSHFDQGRAIHGENREQADLIAMRHGYLGEFTNDSGDGWVCMKVHQATADL
jgi:hypothetical protein